LLDDADGRPRAAISELITLARNHGCGVIAVEDLDFTEARAVGRETLGRGPHGRRFRRTVAGIPTRRFRDRPSQMCTNQGLWVSGRAIGEAGHDPGRVQDPTRPRGARQPHLGPKTGRGNREWVRVQVADDRSRPPVSR
jgi:hypothetical protein